MPRTKPQERFFPPLLNEENWHGFVEEAHLTPREADVLLLITSGCGYDSICERLSMGRPTLRTHLRSAYTKVGCKNRVELILTLAHKFLR
jgi:DNA-binding CsgD family transcriptional regulator